MQYMRCLVGTVTFFFMLCFQHAYSKEDIDPAKHRDLCYFASLVAMDMIRFYSLTEDADDTYKSFVVGKGPLPVFTKAIEDSYLSMAKYIDRDFRFFGARTFYQCNKSQSTNMRLEDVERCFIWPSTMTRLYNDRQDGVGVEDVLNDYMLDDTAESTRQSLITLRDLVYGIEKYETLVKESGKLLVYCLGPQLDLDNQ